MTEYTVTAIRYTIGSGLSFKERDSLAKEFVKNLEVGTKVILEADNNNPVDENAIMVFVNYKLCGYIGREQCLEVRQLLDDNGQADAVVSRHDEEKAFYVTIPGAAEHKIQPLVLKRQLPESPLGNHVGMPFATAEKELDMLSKKLTNMELTKDSIPDFVDMAEHYEPLLDMAICYDDNHRLSVIYEMLNKIFKRKDEFGIDKYLERIESLHNQLHNRVRTMHRRRNNDTEKTFISHLNILRYDTDITQPLYEKYCDAFLNSNKFAAADKDRMRKERERLLNWFGNMEWAELRYPKQLEKMALKLSYLRVSRTEIYDVYGVLLVLEQLDKYLSDDNPTASISSSRKTKATKRKKVGEKRLSGKPKTLKYFTHSNKGVLKKQGERLKLVFDKWNKWDWIDSKTSTDDFDAFFEGEPRHCNITWKANSTILTILLQELLKQSYIGEQKKQSASSMVKEQFELTPNFDQNRLADDDKFRIKVTVYLLNTNNPLPLIKGGSDDDYDVTDAALQAVLSGQLRSTKGI